MNVAVREDLRQHRDQTPENLDPERAGGYREAAIVRCHHHEARSASKEELLAVYPGVYPNG